MTMYSYILGFLLVLSLYDYVIKPVLNSLLEEIKAKRKTTLNFRLYCFKNVFHNYFWRDK